MKKNVIPTFLSVILVIALMAIPVFAKDNQNERQPFQKIWEAITELQEWVDNFLETDPVFVASPAAGISSDDISNWGVAYGWGDHSTAGYLTGYTETDPVFGGSPAAGISSDDISNWGVAYGWGNHATMGYGDGHSLDAVDGNPIDAIFVDNVGEIGIGTTSPSAKLQISDAGSGSRSSLIVTHTGTGGVGRFVNLERTKSPQSLNDMLQIWVPGSSIDDFQFIEAQRGNDVEFRVDGNGEVYADGAFHAGGADFSEMIAVGSGIESVEPGDVMVIDTSGQRAVIKAFEPRSTLVAGIYSTEPGVIGSNKEWDQPEESGDEGFPTHNPSVEIPLAVLGIVPCKVSAENGPISPGDLLVTSSTPGYAMRDDDPKVGTILGKALGSLTSGAGVIDVIVTLQ